MKRKFLLILGVTFFFLPSVKAQISKGSILAGGNFGYSATTTDPGVKDNTFTISPSIGIGISENTIAGISFRYGFYDIQGSNDQQKSYGGGLFLRKYKPLGKGFYLFGEGNLGYDYSRLDQVTFINPNFDTRITKSHTYRLSFNPGVSYAITNRLQLELIFTDFLSASYSTYKRESRTRQFVAEPKTKNFSVNSNLSLNGINSLGIGLRFLLNKSR